MRGMTLKQAARHRYIDLCSEYRALKAKGIHTDEDKTAFVRLSIQIHAAKGDVPKRLWSLANK